MKFREMTPTGKCSVCGINCWAHSDNKPCIWPCGLDACPYPSSAKVIAFPKSATGSSLNQITYEG